MDIDRADLIYHETQTSALCGVHAVNTLLQAPHFSEVDLAQIAQDLDAAEHALMATGGVESAEYLQYVAEGSSNVAENGMFSIQVLCNALEIFGLQAVPLRSPDAAAARADPTSQHAFICNLQEHWFTIRSIHGQWWNLNSIYASPEPLSEFHLAAYLDSLQDEGYTIFVVVGPLPPSQPPATEEERVVPGQAGRWFTPEESRAATEERKRLKEDGYAKATVQGVLGKAADGLGSWMVLRRPGAKRSLDDGGDAQGDDPELAHALAASMADGGASRPGRSTWGTAASSRAAARDDDDADLAAAIAASLADKGGSGSGPQQVQRAPLTSLPARAASPVGSFQGLAEEEDPELAAAIAASMEPSQDGASGAPAQQQQQQQEQQEEQQQEEEQPRVQLPELGAEPEAGAADAIEVAVRLPGGSRASRRFHAEHDTVGHLAAFAAQQGAADVAAGRCQLAVQFPRRVFEDWGATLAAAGIGHKELVVVEPKQ